MAIIIKAGRTWIHAHALMMTQGFHLEPMALSHAIV
jgi:hypothetical protein